MTPDSSFDSKLKSSLASTDEFDAQIRSREDRTRFNNDHAMNVNVPSRPVDRISSRGRFRFIRKEEEKRDREASAAAQPTRPLSPQPSDQSVSQSPVRIVSSLRPRLSSHPLRPVPVNNVNDDAASQSFSPLKSTSFSFQSRPPPQTRIVAAHQQEQITQDQIAQTQHQLDLLPTDEIVTEEIPTTTTEAPIVYPETNFSCFGKILGGLYADVEAGCVMFHICSLELDGR